MIKDIALDELEDWPRNYRRHPAEQIKRLVDSLQRKAVVVQAKTNRIIAGHGVVEAARFLGWQEIRCDVWDVADQQAEAFLVDDNELQRFAEDDELLLAELAGDLSGGDHSVLSFNEQELADLLDSVDFQPVGIEEQSRLDQEAGFAYKSVICPKCGHEFKADIET